MTARRADALTGLAGALAAAGLAAVEGLDVAGVPGVAVAGALLGLARPHPRLAWVLAALALATVAPFGLSLAALVVATAHAFAAARAEPRWPAVAALAGLIGATELGALLAHESPVPALLPAAGWGAGRALRERELVAAQLAERARELEEEHEAYAALSVRFERARIASELHDIVAHALSVMVIQAAAGQRIASDPQATSQTFDAIAEAAREAEHDIGRLVALLGDGDAIGPAPDLALVEELVARAAGSGLDVTLRFEGQREGLPAQVAQAAYHVVREALTNALRYAAGAAVTVLVRGDGEALVVEIDNTAARGEAALAGAGTGTGLQGLRERVAACGGRFEAGPRPGGGWRVSARLPRRIGAAQP